LINKLYSDKVVFHDLYIYSFFKSVVGITVSQFEKLSTTYFALAPHSPYHLDDLGVQEQLLITLAWLRQAFTYKVLGFIFKIDGSTAQRIVKKVLNNLHDLANTEITIPSYEERVEQASVLEGKQFVIVVDGAEQGVMSSNNKLLKNINFSGKKKKHTFTKLIGVNLRGKVEFMSHSYNGSINDLNLIQMPENDIAKYLTEDEFVLGDAGFRGMEAARVIAYNEDEYEGAAGREFKRLRVVVENTIGAIKRWKICYHTFHGKHEGNEEKLLFWHDTVWRVCAWLTNLYCEVRSENT
jgi:hypothetical protein